MPDIDPSKTDFCGGCHRRSEVRIFENEGAQLAGKPVTLPEEVRAELRPRPEGPPRDRPGPPPGRRPPPANRPPPPNDRQPPPDRHPPPPPGRQPPPRPGRGGHQVFQLSAAGMFWVGVRIPIAAAGENQPARGTLVLATKSFYGTPLFFDFKPWLAALAAVVGIFLLCWLPFIRSLTQTISRITGAAEQIEQGNFDQQLPADRSDELGHLSLAINRMAARLSGYVSGQKRFLGDIAHELCAPIARMQFGLGILEQSILEQPAEKNLRTALEDVQEEMRQMSGLVGELLSFSKAGMEAGTDAKDRPSVPVDVEEVVRQAVARESSAPDDVRVEIGEPVVALGGPDLLLRALGNLIRNALRYAGGAGPITVSARREGREIVIAVADCGPGLPPEELDRVFTPFYRLEASRNREHGGAGLGLAIVKSCVEACRGQVRCRNRRPAGLEVEIRLPADPVARRPGE